MPELDKGRPKCFFCYIRLTELYTRNTYIYVTESGLVMTKCLFEQIELFIWPNSFIFKLYFDTSFISVQQAKTK